MFIPNVITDDVGRELQKVYSYIVYMCAMHVFFHKKYILVVVTAKVPVYSVRTFKR